MQWYFPIHEDLLVAQSDSFISIQRKLIYEISLRGVNCTLFLYGFQKASGLRALMFILL